MTSGTFSFRTSAVALFVDYEVLEIAGHCQLSSGDAFKEKSGTII
jgi:hypothetical protein